MLQKCWCISGEPSGEELIGGSSEEMKTIRVYTQNNTNYDCKGRAN